MIDIIIFAIIALLIAHRLYSVLGTTDDNDSTKYSAPVINLDKNQYQQQKEQVVESDFTDLDEDICKKLDQTSQNNLAEILKLDSKFSLYKFSQSAEKAFEIIINAFANGDDKSLTKLCDKLVADSFYEEYKKQSKLGNKININIVGIESHEIKEIKLDKKLAIIKIKFCSEQITTITNRKGEVISGAVNNVEEIVDNWYFARDLSQKSPIWKLAKTTN